MVTQPAYLKNLKAYARSRPEGDDDVDKAVQDYSDESDRGAIILAATYVEDMLELKIMLYMPGLHNDEPTRRRMFEGDGQIATFSRKTELAYALGIIDDDYRKKIDLIREIRNACAHSRKPLSMKTEVLRTACEVVVRDILPIFEPDKPLLLRNAFVGRCLFIAHYITTGEKIDSGEAALAHFKKLVREQDQRLKDPP